MNQELAQIFGQPCEWTLNISKKDTQNGLRQEFPRGGLVKKTRSFMVMYSYRTQVRLSVSLSGSPHGKLPQSVLVSASFPS